jgi:hypothetical protein
MRSKHFAILAGESSVQAFVLLPEAGEKSRGNCRCRDATVQIPAGSAGPPSRAGRSPTPAGNPLKLSGRCVKPRSDRTTDGHTEHISAVRGN